MYYFGAAGTARAIPAGSVPTSRTSSAGSGLPRGEARGDVQGELELQAALPSRVPEQLLGLGEAIADRVVVEPEPLGGGTEVAAGVEEGFEGFTESADVVGVGRQIAELGGDEVAAGLDVGAAQGGELDLVVSRDGPTRLAGELRDTQRFERILMTAAEPAHAARGASEGDEHLGMRVGQLARPARRHPAPHGVDVDADDQRPRVCDRARERACVGLERGVVIMPTAFQHEGEVASAQVIGEPP